MRNTRSTLWGGTVDKLCVDTTIVRDTLGALQKYIGRCVVLCVVTGISNLTTTFAKLTHFFKSVTRRRTTCQWTTAAARARRQY